jgi:hypothetical protein
MAARWQRSRRGTRQKFGRMGLQLLTGCHRPKFLRGGCLDASGTAATATKERLTGAEATKATAAVVRSSRSAGAAGVVRQHDAGGRGTPPPSTQSPSAPSNPSPNAPLDQTA